MYNIQLYRILPLPGENSPIANKFSAPSLHEIAQKSPDTKFLVIDQKEKFRAIKKKATQRNFMNKFNRSHKRLESKMNEPVCKMFSVRAGFELWGN